MMTGNISVSRLLLPALIAVVAIIAAVGAGIGPSTDKAEAVTSQLTIGLDMKTSSGAAGTYNISALPTFEQCVDVKTNVSSGMFYIDVFVLNATGLFAFNADLTFTSGAIQILRSDVKQFFGTSSNVQNISRNYNSATDVSPNFHNISPTVNDGTFFAGSVDTGGTHTGSGVLARIKGQPNGIVGGGVVVDFRFATPPYKGVTLTADPGATHPGDTTGDGIFDGPFINAIGKIAIDRPDGDGDTVSNDCDNCPSNSNASQLDTDGDSLGDACDPDDDNDGIADGSDNCPLVPNPTQDPLACQDSDLDGVLDGLDNCPTISNANQANNDNDALGDVCDPDDDNDTVNDGSDNCPLVSNTSQANWNGNALGDACEDSDGDNWVDSADNCKSLANPSQANSDSDTLGDTCDNCPTKTNATQADIDSDFIGDACDDSDGDGWSDQVELFTGTNRTQKCANDTTSNNEVVDPSPPDTDDNKRINTLDLVPYVSALNSIGPNLPYKTRLDFDMNNRINTLDLVGFIPVLNSLCT